VPGQEKLFDGADVRHFVVLKYDRPRDRLDALEISGYANFIEKSLGYFKQLQSIRIECEEYNRGNGKFFELENMMNGILGVDNKCQGWGLFDEGGFCISLECVDMESA